jgi:hypothetical protein
MYYLVIKNLGIQKCIDKNKNDIYENDQSYECVKDLEFVKNKIIKRIKIKCTEIPESNVEATVYSD